MNAISLFIGFALASPLVMAEEPRNAKEFLQAVSAREGGSAGARNGGNLLISEFFRNGLVGLDYLRFRRMLDESVLVKTHEAILNAKVYPVSFRLCELDESAECTEEQSYAAKNYPALGIVLLDARDLPAKFRRMSIADKVRHAIHEFAGLAEVELSNHSFSTLIDAGDLYEKLDSREEMHEYFAILGSLFNALPGAADPAVFVGTWSKRISFQPSERKVLQGETFLLPGDKYWIEIDGAADGKGFFMEAAQYTFMPSSGRKECKSIAHLLEVEEGTLRERENQAAPPGWKRTLRRKAKNFPEMFTAAEARFRTEVPPFMCKPLSETEMLCRHFYYRWVEYLPVQSARWVFEYALYARTSDSAPRCE